MKKKYVYVLLAAVTLCACGEKKEAGEDVVAVKVKAMRLSPAMSQSGHSYPGTIEETSGTTLSFSGMGTIKELHIREGQTVRAGQLIGTIDATTARNAHDIAQATREQAEDALQRMTMLHDAGSLPEVKWIEVQAQVRQAQAQEQIARKAMTDTRLLAPFSGYIAEKSGEVGQNVAPGIPVARLVKIDQVKVRISIPESEISQIAIGQEVALRAFALGRRLFSGRIVEKGVSGDRLSRSYEVRAVLDNPGHELLPGMVCDVYTSQEQSQVMTIPANLVQIDADNVPFVWTIHDGKARKTALTLGDNAGEDVMVTDGLAEGDSMIVAGQQKVSDGMKVTE